VYATTRGGSLRPHRFLVGIACAETIKRTGESCRRLSAWRTADLKAWRVAVNQWLNLDFRSRGFVTGACLVNGDKRAALYEG